MYDSLDNYPMEVGFSTRFVAWVKECITRTKFSVEAGKLFVSLPVCDCNRGFY